MNNIITSIIRYQSEYDNGVIQINVAFVLSELFKDYEDDYFAEKMKMALKQLKNEISRRG